MSPPAGRVAKRQRIGVIERVAMPAIAIAHVSALIGAVAVLGSEPRAAVLGLGAGYLTAILLARAFDAPLQATFEFACWGGPWLAMLVLGAYAAFRFCGVSEGVAVWLFVVPIALALGSLRTRG